MHPDAKPAASAAAAAAAPSGTTPAGTAGAGPTSIMDHDSTPTGSESQADGVIAKEGESGADANARAQAEADGAAGDADEGTDGAAVEGTEGTEAAAPEGAEVEADLSAQDRKGLIETINLLKQQQAEQQRYLSAVDAYLRQGENRKAAELAAKAQQAEEAKLDPVARLTAKVSNLEAVIQQQRSDWENERRMEHARQTVATRTDQILAADPTLKPWRDVILAMAPTMGNVPDPLDAAAKAVKARLTGTARATADALIKPRQALAGHKVLGKTGGAAPPAMALPKLEIKSREDMVRHLMQANSTAQVEDRQRKANGRFTKQ